MDLVEFLSPKHVILVHGEKPKMATLKGRIQSELGIQCYDPANNETVLIPTTQNVKISATKMFMRSCSHADLHSAPNSALCLSDSSFRDSGAAYLVRNERVAEGILVMEKTKTAKIVCEDEFLQTLHVKEHKVQFQYSCPVEMCREQVSCQLSSGLPPSNGNSPERC